LSKRLQLGWMVIIAVSFIVIGVYIGAMLSQSAKQANSDTGEPPSIGGEVQQAVKPVVQVSLPYSDYHDDFEEGEQEWIARIGVETVAVTTDFAYSGRQSLRVSNRAEAYSGAVKDITNMIRANSHYKFRGWVKLAEGSQPEAIKMTLQASSGASPSYIPISAESVTSDEWIKLEGDFEYDGGAEALLLYFESEHAGVDFYMDDVLITRLGELKLKIEPDIPSLKDVFAHDFIIGTAFTNDELSLPGIELMVKHFDSVTPGNVLKWDSTEPAEGVFRWENSDEAVKFAEKHDLMLRGHTLVWHNQTPQWVFYDDHNELVSKEVLYARMKNHIEYVMGRYKGKMYAWDVVNEVIDEKEPDGLRRSLWYEIAGEEYIEKAFEYARAVDPDAKLYINDYNTEIPAKAEHLYNLVKRLKAKGIPIDGVGHQFHINVEWPSMANLESAITRFADMDVEQQVTELDIDIHTSQSQRYEELPAELSRKQAEQYRAVFDVLKRHAGLINSVTLWGKDDGHTWLTDFPVKRNNWPLLFDERLQAKEAYWSIVDLAK
jgi:endo-1,4-beta-xylanase